MSLLVVMAHFDAHSILRKHTLDALRNYSRAATRVIVVSTSGIQSTDYVDLPRNVEWINRTNYGYDFYSYKWGLDVVGDYAAYDRLLLVNDTFVGPIVPLDSILDSRQAQTLDVLGMTWSENHGGHAQSFFVSFTNAVTRSNAFQGFWREMVPVSQRKSVIMQYEVGLTTVLTDAGFSAGGYLQPTAAELDLAMRRRAYQADVRLVPGGKGKVVSDVRLVTDEERRSFNPAIALADRFLMNARLPLLKFDTLRFDPYGLGATQLLSEAESRLGEHMEGVRSFLRDTRSNYPFRAREHNALSDTSFLKNSGLGYCSDPEYRRLNTPGEQES
ncbi:rhamnan synthesis F family protein [Microbacterium sp. NPDC080220]|uniref:rhamnan synthesis F family protein n=1 Tax=Microbacterium sp. NPDC080220 TaxID=3161017 RepID=UPI003449C247